MLHTRHFQFGIIWFKWSSYYSLCHSSLQTSLHNSIWYKCLQWWSYYSASQSNHYSICNISWASHVYLHHFAIMIPRYDQRYHPLKLYLLQSVRVLALWNILITIQLATMTVIPLTVLLLTHPQVTMLYLIYLLMPSVALTIIVAYVLYWCQQPRRRSVCCNVRYCGKICVQFVVIVAILGLIITLLAVYELMLLVQAHIEMGVKGIVLSLLPSFPLSALGCI